MLGRVLSRAPLLPDALSHGAVGNDALSVWVRDLANGERFHAGPAAFPHAARVPFGDAYGGVLDGFTAEVSLDPAVASKLVPGGLRLTVHPGAELALRQLIEIETACCKWITFELEPTRVTMTAPGDGEQVIQAMWTLDPPV